MKSRFERLEQGLFWLLMACMALWLSLQFEELRERMRASALKNAPVTNWIVVHDLAVPDFHVGQDPLVFFDRVVSTDLFGVWGVEVVSNTGEQVCSATSNPTNGATYRVAENPRVKMAFSLYTGGCVIARPGIYRLTVVLQVRPVAGGPSKQISFQSNWFKVDG